MYRKLIFTLLPLTIWTGCDSNKISNSGSSSIRQIGVAPTELDSCDNSGVTQVSFRWDY